MLSIILEGESFKLSGLRVTFLYAWLTNFAAAYGLAHSMAALGSTDLIALHCVFLYAKQSWVHLCFAFAFV